MTRMEVEEAGLYDLHLRLWSAGGGKLHVEFGARDVSAPVNVPVTGWANWATVTARGVRLDAGRQVMTVAFDTAAAGQGYVANYNWIEARRSP